MMRPFSYERLSSLDQLATFQRSVEDGEDLQCVQYLAGGTTLVDLMKQDVMRPKRVVDLSALSHLFDGIHADAKGLRLGAMAKMSTVADHPVVLAQYPAIAQSLALAASPQLRNMATLGGNVLQRTRCPYFRDPSWSQCNKRSPGSGCAAKEGLNRNHGILGVDESCISQYPGDFGVALIALDAQVEVQGPSGKRTFPFASLHRDPHGQPDVETTLLPGELITEFSLPAGAWTRRSLYLKVRDRASYQFALASAAVALELDAQRVVTARIGVGGAAYRPWRASEAEAALQGRILTEDVVAEAARTATVGAITHGGNDFKPELLGRTISRALWELLDQPALGEEHRT